MSNPRKDLSVKLKDAKRVKDFLGGIAFVDEIYLNGSRSPNSKRKARKDSDWDFICVTSAENVRLRSVRDSHKFHGDVIFISKDILHFYNQACQIWPEDKSGMFKNEQS